MSYASARPKLGAIRAVTYAVPDLRAIERAYVEELGYIVAASRAVEAAQAQAWDAPASEGQPSLLLRPASGEPVYLQFVEDAQSLGWSALESFGWNATEFVVEDVDTLARRIGRAGSPFKIIGEPKSLTRFPMIRAMQAIGPAGECCYFTQVGAGSGLDLAAARCFVGRVFIVVVAGGNGEGLLSGYARFGNPIDPLVATPVAVISQAHGLPASTLHRHALLHLSEGTLIELDEYPSSAGMRTQSHGALPPGMAVVTFDVDRIGEGEYVAPPGRGQLPGLTGTRACLRGAAGELIEVLTHQSGE